MLRVIRFAKIKQAKCIMKYSLCSKSGKVMVFLSHKQVELLLKGFVNIKNQGCLEKL